MNFFEHQDRARRQSRRLLGLFILAVLGVVGAFAALAGLMMGPDLMWPAALAVFALITIASWVRIAGLRSGGGQVAQSLGGTLVPADTSDPLRRRLLNVVEEMAIAAGVSVPEVYVLEQEQAINAFAAGYSPSDAAVAVTRGLLEHLDRAELQGVVAHEFSHILNGDMRINIRLMGFLFGLLMVAVMGQRMMLSTRHARNSKDTGAVVMLSLVIMALGYIGLFFGRLIKAAVSRQREYLADAAAVQLTRNPVGVSGALKKIAAMSAGSELKAEVEEVGHMLFGSGRSAWLLATHPPIDRRIRAIEPGFDPAEIKTIAQQLDRHRQAELARQEAPSPPEARAGAPGGQALGGLLDQLGAPDFNQWVVAGALLQAMPGELVEAAHSDERVEALVLALLLSQDEQRAQQQLQHVREREGDCVHDEVLGLRQRHPGLSAQSRVMLIELSAPAWRRRPVSELNSWLETLDALVVGSGPEALFDLALERLVRLHVDEALRPDRCTLSGRHSLNDHPAAAADWLAMLAWWGRPRDVEKGIEEDATAAPAAWHAAIDGLLEQAERWRGPEVWVQHFDAHQRALNALKPTEKQRLIEAMVRCLEASGPLQPDQYELFRVLAALLHVPVPVRPE
jgi:Zn-dependent protease with chaperone function